MRNRSGVSLIEVMVALVLFGIIATVHTAATMRYGARERIVALGADRAAAIAKAVDLYSTMPRGEVATSVGCVDVTEYPKFPHERCVTTTAVSGSVTRITITLTPDNSALQPVTFFVDRVTSNTTPPFS